MEKTDRKTRIAVMTGILMKNPSKSFPLKYFCEMFGAAKSTISEDLSMIRGILERFGQGELEAALGASGGVKYRPLLTDEKKNEILSDVATKLSDPSRILPGGYIYTVDIFSDPKYVCALADILAGMYLKANPDLCSYGRDKGRGSRFRSSARTG